jgi:hypothetical protein
MVTDDLVRWNSHWRLSDHTVLCRTCKAKQRESERESTFEHLPTCGYAREMAHPWDELDASCVEHAAH